MKFTLLKENLQKAINISQRLAIKTSTLPILENVLIQTEEKRIKISSTNLEMGLHIWVKGKVEKEGKLVLPVAILGALVNTIKEERITIEAKKLDAELITQNFNALIKGQDYNDFPIIPSLNQEHGFTIKAGVLKEALSQLENIVTLSETYPEISGILWNFSKDAIELVATDSFRLGRKLVHIQTHEALAGKGFILPLRTIQELIHIIMDVKEETPIQAHFNENQALFLFEDIYFISRLLSGTYPNYNDLIPKDFTVDISIPRDELANNIKLVRVFSPKTSDIKVEIGQNVLTLSAKTQTGSSEAKVKALVKGSGAQELMFNHRYLLDGLSNIEKKQIAIHVKNEASPALFSGEGDDSYIYVLMPLKT